VVVLVALGVDPIARFKADHTKVRDLLLELIDSIGRKDVQRSLEILIELDKITGPHFRWEEESVYPVFSRFFGRDYLEYLLGVHDRIIRRGRELLEVLQKGKLTDEEARKWQDIIRFEILSHPIECDGITLFADKLTEEEKRRIALDLERVEREGVPLLEWAEKIKDVERAKRGLKAKVLT
jgi:hypothetical protein